MFLVTSPLIHNARTQFTVFYNLSTPNITTPHSHLFSLFTQSVFYLEPPCDLNCWFLASSRQAVPSPFPEGFHGVEGMGTRASRALVQYNLPYTVLSTNSHVCKHQVPIFAWGPQLLLSLLPLNQRYLVLLVVNNRECKPVNHNSRSTKNHFVWSAQCFNTNIRHLPQGTTSSEPRDYLLSSCDQQL